MNELLTAKQVQDLLQVDRTTIYRMLNDGRLTGVKIGKQWRFSRQEVENWLSGARQTEEKRPSLPAQVLPLHCVQPIQDVFAEIAQVSVITTAPNGVPLTKVSNACEFCNLIQSSETGYLACVDSWAELAKQPEKRPKFVTCHAGLQYARARIEVDGELNAMLVAGQFYIQPPKPEEEAMRVLQLAVRYQLNPNTLLDSARHLNVLDDRKENQIGEWLEKVARTFEDISRERVDLIGRLRKIAAMTHLENE